MTDQPATLEAPIFWKLCSSCKKKINFSQSYYLCSVSTCRHVRKGFRFCSVPCWDAHLGYANHRTSFAEESISPSQAEFKLQSSSGVVGKVKVNSLAQKKR